MATMTIARPNVDGHTHTHIFYSHTKYCNDAEMMFWHRYCALGLCPFLLIHTYIYFFSSVFYSPFVRSNDVNFVSRSSTSSSTAFTLLLSILHSFAISAWSFSFLSFFHSLILIFVVDWPSIFRALFWCCRCHCSWLLTIFVRSRYSFFFHFISFRLDGGDEHCRQREFCRSQRTTILARMQTFAFTYTHRHTYDRPSDRFSY